MLSLYLIDSKLKRSIATLLVVMVSICIAAQNDTIFFIKNGQVIFQQSIKAADVDSITFYRPKQVTQPIELSFVDIPAGTFTMGSPETEPDRNTDETQHQVTLSAFKMSKFEITNAQFAAFLNAKGIGSDGIFKDGEYPTNILIYASDKIDDGNYNWGLIFTDEKWIPVSGYENHPVMYVSWFGATEFATYSGGKLPTEAQWEYACRAGTTTPFNTGNCLTNEQANYNWKFPYVNCSNSDALTTNKTQAVGSYPANIWGLHDMHGNIMEWCSDWYRTEYSTTPVTNPTGPATGYNRVVRGSNFGGFAYHCRSAHRNYISPGSCSPGIGFRIVLIP